MQRRLGRNATSLQETVLVNDQTTPSRSCWRESWRWMTVLRVHAHWERRQVRAALRRNSYSFSTLGLDNALRVRCDIPSGLHHDWLACANGNSPRARLPTVRIDSARNTLSGGLFVTHPLCFSNSLPFHDSQSQPQIDCLSHWLVPTLQTGQFSLYLQ